MSGEQTKTDLRSLTCEELREEMLRMGESAFRGGQIFEWLHKKQARTTDEMTSLPLALRQKLKENYETAAPEIAERYVSALDGTRKYVFSLADGNRIESVLMRYEYGLSVCISSQVGCRMGCRFCASTLDGLARGLSAGEMLGEVYTVARDAGERISHIVIMGTGEPLDNYDALIRFLDLVTDPRGMGLSERNITVSTCGLVPQIRKLAAEKRQITLALSLHAATDEARRELMPVARRYTIAETLAACEEYFRATGRRMSYEYSLVRGVNDREDDARQLAGLLKGRNCHVNLIPVNPIAERDFRAPEAARAAAFKKSLEKYGINATIRRKMGADIDSACGQLRRGRRV